MAACRMSEISHQHTPVLLNEVVENLVISPDAIYVDATFGRGSHSQAILNRLSEGGRLYAIDKDPDAVAYAKQQFAHDVRFTIFHGSFARLSYFLENVGVWGKVSGILFDLGVSSPQLDNPSRGFSFLRPGKLDMRMDTTRGIDAATWLAQVSERELADVLFQYGDERFSRKIAKAIVAARTMTPIVTTTQLADIIARAMPRYPKDKHPATRSFQAIRIFLNEELTELQQGLEQAQAALVLGGRLLVISFHSLEDRIVKQFVRQHERGETFPRDLPIKHTFQPRLKQIGKPIKPSSNEIAMNPRARSAILRIVEKVS